MSCPTLESHADLMELLDRYRQRWPGEAAVVAEFESLLRQDDAPFTRERSAGHFTGSAWLVDASGTRVLLTHHRKLGRWLQLGGHADGETDLAQVARREASEESGLEGLQVEAEVFDLDRHWIPERGEEPGHWHYDVRHVVRTGADQAFVVGEESLDLAWREIASIAADQFRGDGADESLRRMARKWLQRTSSPA
ncbi:MAG: NUDIX hydrolase [Pseudomonadota bacterium]|nr:NUDIX hydrolase [Pseudomonadota bacterium]